MRKKNLRKINPVSEINVVPYIDVMLVLLVIFMITAPMLTQGVKVNLPKAASETVSSQNREPIIISVNKDGQYFLNLNSDPLSEISAQNMMVRVAAELELAKQSKESLPVLVKGDEGVNYGKIITAMSLLKQAGAQEVGLITDSVDEGTNE